MSLIFLQPVADARGDSLDPWSYNVPESFIVDKGCASSVSMASEAVMKSIFFFKEYISAVDGDRCMMHPSCSTYSLMAIERHGFIMGYIMTVDRLIHENNEMDFAEIVKIGDHARYHDPVENNDFWWYKVNRISNSLSPDRPGKR